MPASFELREQLGRAVFLIFILALLPLAELHPAPSEHRLEGAGWTMWRQGSKASVMWIDDVEYIPTSRSVRVDPSGANNRTCPSISPELLTPKHTGAVTAIGGLYNLKDPVFRTMMTCEVLDRPFVDGDCTAMGSLDLYVWQPGLAFYTHGSASLLVWIHDHLSPLLHAVQLSEGSSTGANADASGGHRWRSRGLVVLHHSHSPRPLKRHHPSLGGGRRALLEASFGAGLWTLGLADGGNGKPLAKSQAAALAASAVSAGLPQGTCLKLRRLVVGSGLPLGEQQLATRRATVGLLRAAGFRAAGLPGPPPAVTKKKGPVLALHVLAVHQHRHLHDHHHKRMHRHHHHQSHSRGHHKHRANEGFIFVNESHNDGSHHDPGSHVDKRTNQSSTTRLPHFNRGHPVHAVESGQLEESSVVADPRGLDPHPGSSFMAERFGELEVRKAVKCKSCLIDH